MNLSPIEIQQRIFSVRGQKVILDSDLASLFQIQVRALNQAVRRNADHFPEDFAFQLTAEEYSSLRSQFVTLKNGRGKHRKYLPWVFAEHGVAMLANILRSKKALEIAIAIIRTFVRLRHSQAGNGWYEETTSRIDYINSKLDQIVETFERFPRAYSTKSNVEVIDNAFESRVYQIQRVVCAFYRVGIKDLKSKTRTKSIALPRQVAMYLIRKHTSSGLLDIGVLFGGRDHTTVLHACKKIEKAIRAETGLLDDLREIERHLPYEKVDRVSLN